MGPVELIFLTVFVVSCVIGVVRGYPRELGVTTMLLLALFVLEFVDEQYRAQFTRLIAIVAGPDEATQAATRALVYCAVIVIVTFISYEGETLAFPGKRGRFFFDLGSGVLNGYLLAGSLWYYLQAANWPILRPTGEFSSVYYTLVQYLPPAVFHWPYLVGLAVIMLIARIWK